MAAMNLKKPKKVNALHTINSFPKGFEVRFAEQIAYMHATRSPMKISGDDWEDIFAKCIGGMTPHQKVGLDDVVMGSSCWSAKTIESSSKDFSKISGVRLISGRNSISFTFSNSRVLTGSAVKIGKEVLTIWNERVQQTKDAYESARIVVLVRSKNCSEFLIFEKELETYDPAKYVFKRNKSKNVVGYIKQGKKLIHKFTWQHSGSQFTIIEDVPKERLHLTVQRPPKMEQDVILKTVGFDKSWVKVL